MAAETQYTANTGMGQVTVANANLDGTGTVATILTAASNGTLIKSITVKGTGTNAEGMVRLFLNDNNGNIRLIEEIPVPANTVSGTNPAFEYSFDCDYTLKAGWFLQAATQNAETFNIIAEGLNWTYYTAMVRPESTQYTANNGTVVISTANPNRDGTGTLGTVITAGSSATYKGYQMSSVTFKALGNTTTGTLRLFLYDGTNTRLLSEIMVPAITQTGTEPSFERTINLSRFLQAGWSIKASTENAESFAVSIEGNDWKYPTSNFITNYTPASGTAVTTEELLHSLQVPANLMASGGMMEVQANIAANSNANSKTFRIYVNTTNSLSGATLVATHATSNSTGDCIQRYFPIISDTALECYGGATGDTRASTAVLAAGTSANVTVPSVSAGFWVLVSGQKAVAGDTDTIRWSMVRQVF
ncbi:MAG: hypothetical protein ACXVP0_07270 [Bacteroidia bacterium]